MHVVVEPPLHVKPVGQSKQSVADSAEPRDVFPSTQAVRASDPEGQYDPAMHDKQLV